MTLQNEEKAMLVPVRTVAGDRVLKDSDANLSRKLRALLSAIDNRAKAQVYCATLSAFGDVSSMLDTLKDIGMVRFVGNRNDVATSAQLSFDSQSAIDARPQTAPDSSLEDLLRQDSRSLQATAQAKSQPQQSSRQSVNVFKQFHHLNSGPTYPGSAANLEKVKVLMRDFVRINFPSDAMELALAIDQIRNLDDLLESLSTYQKIAIKAVKSAPAHLTAIQTLLQQ
jgi:hypothetical protein